MGERSRWWGGRCRTAAPPTDPLRRDGAADEDRRAARRGGCTASLGPALLRCWAVFAVIAAMSCATVLALIHGGAIPPERLGRVVFAGVSNVSIPVLRSAVAAGLPLALAYFLLNGTVVLLLFGIPLGLRLRDPLAGARRLGRLAARDPTLALFGVFPAFRRIGAPELRPLFPSLAVIPWVVPVVIGVVIGTFLAVRTDAAAPLRSFAVAVANLAPHGLPELTAIFVPVAGVLALHARLRGDLEAGRVEAVSAAIREETSGAALRPRVALALGLIALAAVFEAHLSGPISGAVGRALGWTRE